MNLVLAFVVIAAVVIVLDALAFIYVVKHYPPWCSGEPWCLLPLGGFAALWLARRS